MRTKNEIADEIKRLKALRPVGPYAGATRSKILHAIEELEFGVDDTAEEWLDLDDSEQDIVMSSRAWKEGNTNDKPSDGWGLLVECKRK
jgi:hypothetical protein